MKRIKGVKVKKYWGFLYNISYNNYSVECFLLENNTVFLQALKYSRNVPKNKATISLEEFRRWEDRDGAAIDNLIECLKMLDPKSYEIQY